MNENKFEAPNKVMEEKNWTLVWSDEAHSATIWYERANEAFVCILEFALDNECIPGTRNQSS